jgi:hypothetical protein
VGYTECPMPRLPDGVPLLQKPFTPATLVRSIQAALHADGVGAAMSER